MIRTNPPPAALMRPLEGHFLLNAHPSARLGIGCVSVIWSSIERMVNRRRLFAGGAAAGAVIATGGTVLGGAAHGIWPLPGMDVDIDIPPKPLGAIRIVVWNIRRGAVRDAPGPLEQGITVLKTTAEACLALGPDILSMPEVDRNTLRTLWTDQPAYLARKLGMSPAYGPTVRRQGFTDVALTGGDRGDALFVGGYVMDQGPEEIPLHWNKELARAEARTLLCRTVDLGARSGVDHAVSTVVGSTHLSVATTPETAHLGMSARFETRDQLRECLSTMKAKVNANRSPFAILAGDFNIYPEDVRSIVRKAGWPGLRLIENDEPTTGNDPEPIDHVIVAGFEPFGATAVRVVRNLPNSDHYALVVDVSPLSLERAQQYEPLTR